MLKIYFSYAGIAACLLFVQASALLPFGNHGIRPDLLLIVVLYAAVTLPPVLCASIVFTLGFFFEALSGSYTGLFISIYLLVFATVKLLCRFFNFQTFLELFGLLLVCLAVKHLLMCFFLYFIYEYQYDYIIDTVFKESLFTIIFFPLIFPLLRKLIQDQRGRNSASAKTA